MNVPRFSDVLVFYSPSLRNIFNQGQMRGSLKTSHLFSWKGIFVDYFDFDKSVRTCWQESSRRRRGFVDDLPGVTAVTEAECGGEGARGGAGALISSPSRTYKVFVTGAAISVLSEVGLDTPGTLLGHRAGHPSSVLAQCWSPQHSHMACKLQPGELLGGSSATSNHCHLHTSKNFQGCWL